MVQPNQKKLLIPRKGINDPTNLDINWHEIEAWANAAAGSQGPQGPQGAQGAQGASGGGGSPGYGTMTAGMDSTIEPFAMWIGPTDLTHTGQVTLGPLQPSLVGAMSYTFATSWITETGVTASVNFLPIFTAPSFTNVNPIIIEFYFNAMEINAAFANFGFYFGSVSLTSGATVQTTTGDLTPLFGGAAGDLSLVAGTGTSGNGLVSASGTPLYIASVTGNVNVPAGTTFP